jgi:peptidoglycan-associated lipoprotein
LQPAEDLNQEAHPMKLSMSLIALSFAMGCASTESRQETAHADTVASHHVVSAIPRSNGTEVASGDVQALMQSLDRVYFPIDSSVVPDDAKESVREAARILREHPDLRVYVLGFADEQGAETYNWRLGLERAHAVCALLQTERVDMNQVAVISFGEERPLVDAETQAAYSLNRRVEFRVMRGDTRITLGAPFAPPTAGDTTPRS